MKRSELGSLLQGDEGITLEVLQRYALSFERAKLQMHRIYLSTRMQCHYNHYLYYRHANSAVRKIMSDIVKSQAALDSMEADAVNG